MDKKGYEQELHLLQQIILLVEMLHGDQCRRKFGVGSLFDFLVLGSLMIVEEVVEPGQVHFELFVKRCELIIDRFVVPGCFSMIKKDGDAFQGSLRSTQTLSGRPPHSHRR
jgi:hypothetical protein